MTAEDIKQERDELSQKLCDVENLVAALEVVSWQLCQMSFDGEPAQLRDAVVGISRSMAREVRRQ